MSEIYDASKPLPGRNRIRRLLISVLLVSAAIHIVGLLIFGGTVLFRSICEKEVQFEAPPKVARVEPPRREYKIRAQEQQKRSGSPTVQPRLSANRVSDFALPDIKTKVAPVKDAPSAFQNSMQGGVGDGFGDGVGIGGSGSIFGARSGPGLTGTFYDLKQTAAGEPSSMKVQSFETGRAFDGKAPVNKEYDTELARAARRKFSDESFSNFYQADQKLRLTQLYIPMIAASEAPKSFDIETVEGRRWVIAYRGRVTPPVSGRYRFVGFADDVLIVLANNDMVLDGSLMSPFGGSNRNGGFQQQHTNKGWKTIEGKWMTMTAGRSIDLTIVTGERPGGFFLSYLLIEKQGEDFEVDGDGARKLPLFKLAPGPTPKRGKFLPELAADTPWSVWPTFN